MTTKHQHDVFTTYDGFDAECGACARQASDDDGPNPYGSYGTDAAVASPSPKRRRLAYFLFDVAGRLLPADERKRLLRVLRTGDPEDRVPVDQVILAAAVGVSPETPATTEEERHA